MPVEKKFRLRADEIRRLIPPLGGCLASDRITVDGRSVGYMYRDEPDYPEDSGWRFVAGDESQEYLDNPDFCAIYEVNTIANYDPTIIPYLNAPIGSDFQRDPETGEFLAVTG
jgi:hypothetical protein